MSPRPDAHRHRGHYLEQFLAADGPEATLAALGHVLEDPVIADDVEADALRQEVLAEVLELRGLDPGCLLGWTEVQSP